MVSGLDRRDARARRRTWFQAKLKKREAAPAGFAPGVTRTWVGRLGTVKEMGLDGPAWTVNFATLPMRLGNGLEYPEAPVFCGLLASATEPGSVTVLSPPLNK